MGLANMNISPTKEMINMNKTTIICKGKQQPSQQALDRFIDVYKKMVEANKKGGYKKSD